MTVDVVLVLIGCATLVLMGLGTEVAIYFAIRREIHQEGQEMQQEGQAIRQEFRQETARLVGALASHEHRPGGEPTFQAMIYDPEAIERLALALYGQDEPPSSTNPSPQV